MPRTGLSPEALTLIVLRSWLGWSKKQLAATLGFADEKQFSRYERGEKPLSRENLDSLAAALGYSPETLDALLFAFRLVFPEEPEEHAEAVSPVALSAAELRRIDRAVMAVGWSVASAIRACLVQQKSAEKAEAARREAGELWQRLRATPRGERRELARTVPAFRSWALVVRVCEASVRVAAHRTEEALELADLALFIAEQSPGEESWRARLQGYAWAHVANARRVANDFAGADKAFARVWELWRGGADVDPALLPEWRLLDLEASLRREQRRFPEALELLDRARAACGGDPLATGRILLNKEHVYDEIGDVQGALAALAEAVPFVEASRDLHLLFALRFKVANIFCQLRRYEEAADLLPQVRELAVQQGNELDLIRVVWLGARIAAGQGATEEAIAGLEQVCRDFTVRGLPYDAALSTLELAALYLEQGRTREVKALAPAMAWIFKAQDIRREALATLSLFCEAAQREAATAELARTVIADIEKARRSAPEIR